MEEQSWHCKFVSCSGPSCTSTSASRASERTGTSYWSRPKEATSSCGAAKDISACDFQAKLFMPQQSGAHTSLPTAEQRPTLAVPDPEPKRIPFIRSNEVMKAGGSTNMACSNKGIRLRHITDLSAHLGTTPDFGGAFTCVKRRPSKVIWLHLN